MLAPCMTSAARPYGDRGSGVGVRQAGGSRTLAGFPEQTGIPVVIDAAASFEAISDEPSRLLSELPVALSFHATKAFATGEGGCVITTDAELATSVTRSLNFGFYEDRESRSASTNGKMSEYHAAVGLAELDAWPAKHHAFLRMAETYKTLHAPRRPRRIDSSPRRRWPPATCSIEAQTPTRPPASRRP